MDSNMESVDVSELVERLSSEEDAVRKMAVFKLQSNIGDPSFADVFITEGGLTKLRYLILHATGNTLAYSLTAFSRLLEVDKGWDCVDQDLVKRVVELVVTHPLVNILRGAMSVLVAVVSHPHTALSKTSQPHAFGFRALKPAITAYPQFLEMLVSRLSSADHALCTNALQLINSLMREAITTGGESEWPKFIKKLQDLGVIRGVYGLMQGTALQDLAQPLLEFQALSKVLLRKWRDVPVDLEKSEHRRCIKGIHLASNPPKSSGPSESGDDGVKRVHNPEKWRRLGFESENPAWEFEEVGFLGMMDLTDYVRKNEDGFQKLLLEQSTQLPDERCPVAKASLAVTAMLYEHFEVDKFDLEDTKGYLALESKSSIDKIFRPMILVWGRLHMAGLQAFQRLWKSTGAEVQDFIKVAKLVQILLEAVVGGASRTKEISEIENELATFDYQRLRELQMELFELTYEDNWGHHLRQVKDELDHEALQFIKEQRIRCLLKGAWFPTNPPNSSEKSPVIDQDPENTTANKFRYVRLSHNRRWLHYTDFDTHMSKEPSLDELPEKIDLFAVSSVVSNVSAPPTARSSTSTLTTLPPDPRPTAHATRITIHGFTTSSSSHQHRHRQRSSSPSNHPTHPTSPHHAHHHTNSTTKSGRRRETPLLTLHPQSHTTASEWLDGLLMLLNQQPITSDTNKLLALISGYGLKIRLLNMRIEEMVDGVGGEGPAVPGREGLDDDYFFEIEGGV